MSEPLKKSKTLRLARLHSVMGLFAAALSILPEVQQLLWLRQLVPGPLVLGIMFIFALALAWRRLSDQLDREKED